METKTKLRNECTQQRRPAAIRHIAGLNVSQSLWRSTQISQLPNTFSANATLFWGQPASLSVQRIDGVSSYEPDREELDGGLAETRRATTPAELVRREMSDRHAPVWSKNPIRMKSKGDCSRGTRGADGA